MNGGVEESTHISYLLNKRYRTANTDDITMFCGIACGMMVVMVVIMVQGGSVRLKLPG